MKTSRLIGCSIAVILLILQKQVDGLQCYVCNSHNDSRCAMENLPDSLKKDCSVMEHGNSNTMCRKITQVIEFEVNGLQPESRVIRSCGKDDSNYKGRCYQRSGFGGRQEVCSCIDDYCNGASIPGIVSGSMLAIPILASLYYALRGSL